MSELPFELGPEVQSPGAQPRQGPARRSEPAFSTNDVPELEDAGSEHYAQRAILAMYPRLREDHLRYLQKWGLLRPALRARNDVWYTFAGLTLLRQVHSELSRGAPFRSVVRELHAAESGQLAFDFRLSAEPARILSLSARPANENRAAAGSHPAARDLTPAEELFLHGSQLDDGNPEQLEAAAHAYRQALDEDPDLVAAIINLANVRYSRDELAEAQALYERAIALDPNYFEAHFNLGNIHHDHGRFADAEHCYRSALALNPEYAEAHFYMAVTLEKAGRSADARAHWRAYQRLAPEGEWVELAREFSE